MDLVQASAFWPPMFIEHEPQIPSRHERLNVRLGSMLFLIQINPSRTMGPQSSVSTKYVSMRGLRPSSGSQRYTLNCRKFCESGFGQVIPSVILEFLGSVNATMSDIRQIQGGVDARLGLAAGLNVPRSLQDPATARSCPRRR